MVTPQPLGWTRARAGRACSPLPFCLVDQGVGRDKVVGNRCERGIVGVKKLSRPGVQVVLPGGRDVLEDRDPRLLLPKRAA